MTSFVVRRSIPSMLALVALLAGVGLFGVWYADLPLWFAFAFSGGMVLLQYVVNPWVIQWLVPAERVDEFGAGPHHDLYELVRRRCADAGVPMVRLGIVDDGTPNAFTFGRTRRDARIWITRGLLERLDERELDAVVAHELGHVKNRDFAVMTVAAVGPMVLYLTYLLARSDRKRGLPVAVVAYVAYVVSQFVLLALSRARELAADHWSCACTGDGDALASALVKVAYGMGVARAQTRDQEYALAQRGRKGRAQAEEIESRVRRTDSMRAMGIFEPRTADAMAAAFSRGVDPERALGAMRWDLANPWARVLELASSHPLVARRIASLERSGLPGAPRTWSVLHAAATPTEEERAAARRGFEFDVAVMVAPYAVLVPLVALGAFRGSSISVAVALAAGGALLLVKQSVRYPGDYEPVDDVASLLTRLDAGPMRGIAVSVSGTVIGRGSPGYVLSPDLVIADDSGFVPLLYRQPLPFVRPMFGLFRVRRFLGQRAVAHGWYRRAPGPVIELRHLRTAHDGTRTWWSTFAYAVGVLLVFAGICVALGTVP